MRPVQDGGGSKKAALQRRLRNIQTKTKRPIKGKDIKRNDRYWSV